MNLSTRRREEPKVELASFIDVVFLLLIFFMVTTTFTRESSVQINLPEASGEATAAQETERLEITITADNRYFVNNRELINAAPETLERALREIAGDREGLPVTIVADADARHQAVISAMDVAGQLGFSTIDIATVSSSNDGR